jgi:hypothetical protein
VNGAPNPPYGAVLGPHRANFLVGRELAASRRGLRASDRFAFLRGQRNGGRQLRTGELDDNPRDFVLFARRQQAHGLQGLFEEFLS